MNIPWIGMAGCALAALASALASLFIKFSQQQDGAAWSAGRMAWLAGAAATYALGFVFYTMALQRIPMSLAYPVMVALAMLLVALGGHFVLQEALTGTRLLGIALIAAGAFALASTAE